MEQMNVVMNWNKVRIVTPNDQKKVYVEYGGKDTGTKTKNNNGENADLSLSEVLANSLRKEYPQNE